MLLLAPRTRYVKMPQPRPPTIVDAWRETLILQGCELPVVVFRINDSANLLLVRDIRNFPVTACDDDPAGELSILDHLVEADNSSDPDDDSIFANINREALHHLIQCGLLRRDENCEAIRASDVIRAARVIGYPEAYARELELLATVRPPQRAFTYANRLPLHYEDPLPSSLPECNLPDIYLLQAYGIAQSELSMRVQMEIDRYVNYGTDNINLERVNPVYRKSVQSTTIVSETDRIRGFLGYLSNRLSVDIDRLGLATYWNANFVARFISFLIARETAKGTVIKHLTQAKKVSSFLVSARCTSRKEQEYAARYAEWLDLLQSQLASTLPDGPGYGELPTYTRVRQWVDSIRKEALTRIEDNMHHELPMRRDLAVLIQRAIVASLLIGRDFPPLRLSLIKHLDRPQLDPYGLQDRIRCKDPDCLRGHSCLGNRLEYTDYDRDGVPQGLRLHVVHHKTDRKGPVSREPFHFDLAEGSDILTLMLLHLQHTRDLLNDPMGYRRNSMPTATSRVSTFAT